MHRATSDEGEYFRRDEFKINWLVLRIIQIAFDLFCRLRTYILKKWDLGRKMSVEDILNGEFDNNIEERVRKASLNGNVLRYACQIEGTRYSNIHVTLFKTWIGMLICC